MFILLSLDPVPPNLLQASEDACFRASDSGWMTRRSFLLWGLFLAYDLSVYQQMLDLGVHEFPIFFVLDGHPNRASYEAMAFLAVR
jgi:hypothetical protein